MYISSEFLTKISIFEENFHFLPKLLTTIFRASSKWTNEFGFQTNSGFISRHYGHDVRQKVNQECF